MRRFSPNFIDQVCASNDIVDIIGEDTFLKFMHNRYVGLCPFHSEKTPSFSVSAEKQLYHCFSCEQSGNILTYLQVKKGLHFVDAVKMLADRANISLPNDLSTDAETSVYQERKKLLLINLYASQFYHQQLLNLPSTHKIKKYLIQRDISDQTIQKFKLGYALSEWKELFSYLKQKSCDLNLAMQLGLIRKKESHYYDLFRDRIMFPVFSKNGIEVLGFGGRTLDGTQAKYINSTDSSIFHKGKTFYGWQQSASFIRESEQVLVVEGYTDYLSLYQRGVYNVVATLGTALTIDHANWLSKYTQNVILFFDGDTAGIKASTRSLNILLSVGLAPKILKLDQNKDPDSFIRENGLQALQEKVKLAPDLFLSVFSEELKQYPTGVDRLFLIQKIANILADIKKEVLREYYINRFLDSFGFDEKLAKQALDKALKIRRLKLNKSFLYKKQQVIQKSTSIDTLSIDSQSKMDMLEKSVSLKEASKIEISLLILALQKPEYYQSIIDSGVIEKLNHKGVIKLFKIIIKYNTQELKCFEGLSYILSSYLQDPREIQIQKYPALKYLPSEKVSVFIKDCIDKIEEQKKHLILKDITADMRLDKGNTEKYLLKIAKWTKNFNSTEN